MALKAGYKQTEVGVIPVDWEVVPIGKLLEFKNGLNKAKEYFGYGTPIINYMDVYQHSGLTKKDIKGKVNVTFEEIRAYSAKKGDMFFTRTSETVDEIGISTILLEEIQDAVFSGFVLRGRSISSIIDPHFKKYCFSSVMVRKQIKSTSSYTTRALTNGKNLSKIYLPLPPTKAEQTAIANVLSDTDALIQSLTRLIAKKRQIKQGAMQTLLNPYENGRLKAGWVVSELNDVCERISVGLATSVTKHYRSGGVPIIRNMNIKDGYFDSSDMLYLNPEFAKNNLSKAAKALDVLTVHTGSNLGLTCVLPSEFHNCQTFTTLITTPIKTKLDPYYLCYHMSSSQGKNEMQRLQVGGGKGNLNTGDLKKYHFAFPSSKAEQTQIATILSDMDTEITALESKLSKYQQIKQGMMQNLLTGQIRLVSPETGTNP